MKKKIALLLAGCMMLGLTACGGSTDTSGTSGAADTSVAATESTGSDDGKVYAVEAGSAGEAAAEENGFAYNSVASQADALMEVASGTSDAAIIDLLMAGAMIGEGTSYPNLVHTDELTTEEYGVGCRKGSDLASFINEVFAETYADGSMQSTAEKYGVQEALVEQGDATYEASAEDSDVEAIKAKGTLIVGITEFEPMDYTDDSGEWIGFDADMARIVGEKLGVEVQFVVIDWDTKEMELDSGNVDVIWNGMTLTDEVTSAMECTNAYCNNAQVVVEPAN
jgi:polar amino acid transport system substrate-binding protein